MGLEGIFFESFVKDQVNDFMSLGFTILGTFEEKTKGYDDFTMVKSLD